MFPLSSPGRPMAGASGLLTGDYFRSFGNAKTILLTSDDSTIIRSGSTVTRWQDQSGNAWDAISESGKEPAYNAGLTNLGYAGLTFASDSMLISQYNTTAFLHELTGASVYVVLRNNNGSTNALNCILGTQSSGGGTQLGVSLSIDDRNAGDPENQLRIYGGNGSASVMDVTTANNAINTSAINIISYRWGTEAGASNDILINNAYDNWQAAEKAAGTPSSSNGGALAIGRFGASGTLYMVNADYLGLLIYSTKHSNTTHDLIVDRLAELFLPAVDFVSLSGDSRMAGKGANASLPTPFQGPQTGVYISTGFGAYAALQEGSNNEGNTASEHGPEMGIGYTLKAITGDDVYIAKSATSGYSAADEYGPPSGTGYTNLVADYNNGFDRLYYEGKRANVLGMCFNLGTNDARNTSEYPVIQASYEDLVDNLRTDCRKLAAAPILFTEIVENVSTLAGTVSSSGTTVTGTGTAFLTGFDANQEKIVADGEERLVTAVASDTSLTIQSAFTAPLSGDTYQRRRIPFLEEVNAGIDAVIASRSNIRKVWAADLGQALSDDIHEDTYGAVTVGQRLAESLGGLWTPYEGLTNAVLLLDARQVGTITFSGTSVTEWYNMLDGTLEASDGAAAPTWGAVNGRFGIQGNGSTQYLDMGHPSIETDIYGADKQFTFNLGIDLQATTSENLLGQWTSASGKSFLVQVISGKLVVSAAYISQAASNRGEWTGSTTLSTGTWYDIEIIYDGALDTNGGADRLTVKIGGTEETLTYLLTGSLGDIPNAGSDWGILGLVNGSATLVGTPAAATIGYLYFRNALPDATESANLLEYVQAY